MTLLVIDDKELYNFQNLEDTVLWLNMNPQDKFVIIPEDEFDEDFQMFLEYNAPIIME